MKSTTKTRKSPVKPPATSKKTAPRRRETHRATVARLDQVVKSLEFGFAGLHLDIHDLADRANRALQRDNVLSDRVGLLETQLEYLIKAGSQVLADMAATQRTRLDEILAHERSTPVLGRGVQSGRDEPLPDDVVVTTLVNGKQRSRKG